MHLTRHGARKRAHRTPFGAMLHKGRHRREYADPGRLSIYPCWFTDDGKLGRRHWHIGHEKAAWHPSDQASRKASRRGAYIVGVRLTPGELARLREMAG